MKFQNHIGLDIGSQAIKLVQLSPVGDNKYNLVAIGQAETPHLPDPIENTNAKVEAIKKLVKDTRSSSRQVALSLPESQVYTRVVEMPNIAEPELSQAIRWQAEQYIPVSLNDVVLKHQVLSREEGEADSTNAKINVLLLAAPNVLLSDYTSLATRAGLEPVAIETEILAAARALIGGDLFSPTTLLVHIGAEMTTLSILARGDLAFTQSVSTGGSAIARAVASSLNLDFNQAEEYKRSYGMDETKLDGKIHQAMKPIIEIILSEIKRVHAFYDTHSPKEPVKRVVLSGGTALIPGLVQYFTINLDLEVQIGNPFLPVNLDDRQKKEIGDSGALYATATGLALKLT